MKTFLRFVKGFLKEKFKLTGKIFFYTFFVIIIVLLLYITSARWSTIIEVFGWENPSSLLFNLFIFSVVILVGAILAVIFASRLTRDIRKLTKAAELIGSGDLRGKDMQHKERIMPDETDELYDSVNQMHRNLKDLVSLLKVTASRIYSSSDFLMQSVEIMNGYSGELSVAMNEILSGAKKQKDMVDIDLDNIRNMANIITNSVERANKASSSMQNANKTAVTGEELAKDAISRMKNIFDKVEASGNALSNFVEKFNQINKIVAIITGIAQRTNLLALNASIEAARAGEMGKGFTIVAEEIRKLADNTSKSANQISELVKPFEKESEGVLSSIKESMLGIEENRTDVGIIINSLENIVKNVADVSSKVDDIARLSQDQTYLADKIVASSESVGKIAQHHTEQVIQMSTTFNKEIGAIDKMRVNAQNMSELSNGLRGILSKFKIEDNL